MIAASVVAAVAGAVVAGAYSPIGPFGVYRSRILVEIEVGSDQRRNSVSRMVVVAVAAAVGASGIAEAVDMIEVIVEG